MRQAIENIHGALRDKELPSKSLVAQKLEQIEDNAFHVEDLRDVTSLEDSPQRLLSCASSPARPSPANAEQLRLRHRRIGLTWEMLRTKHLARPWLPERCLDGFRKLSDHILGERIAGVKGPRRAIARMEPCAAI